MTRFLVYGCLGTGFLTLAVGWALTGHRAVSIFLLLLTLISLYLVQRKWIPAMDIAFVLGVLSAGLGVSVGMTLPYALTGVLTLLIAWDLDGFSRRLAFASLPDGPKAIQTRHMLWLGIVLLTGLGISLLVLNLRLEFSFELSVGLAVLVFVSLAALLGWLSKLPR